MSSMRPSSTQDLPSPSQVFYDVVEWWCHTILQEPPGPHFQRRCVQLEQLTRDISLQVPPFGRLRNRIMICATAQGVCGRNPLGDTESCEYLHAADWTALLQELQECRSHILRTDHNDVMGDENARIDQDLEGLPIFNEAYEEVVHLYNLQITICEFRAGLEALIRNRTENTSTINKQLEQLLANYKAGIPDDLKAGDLLTFVQNDLLKAGPQKANPRDNTVLVEKLLAHLNAVMTTNDAEYSYNTLQLKLLELLKDWYGDNLTQPALVLLGYGGIPPLQHTDVNDKHTVSSWGMDETDREDRRKIEGDDVHAHAIDDSDDSGDFYTAASFPETQQLQDIEQDIDSETDLEDVPEEQLLKSHKLANRQAFPVRFHDISDRRSTCELQGNENDEEQDVVARALRNISPVRTHGLGDFSDVEDSQGPPPQFRSTQPFSGCMVMEEDEEEDQNSPIVLRNIASNVGKKRLASGQQWNEGGMEGKGERVESSSDHSLHSSSSEDLDRTITNGKSYSLRASFTHDSDDDGLMGKYGQGATRKRRKSAPQQYSLAVQKEAIRKGYEQYGADWSTIRANSNCLAELKSFQIKQLYAQMVQNGEFGND